MCTLTYLLNDKGYELFFNRDEQRSRLLAIPPKLNSTKDAIYPIDRQGKGTWIAVNKQGMSIALLNNYQAPISNKQNIVSRGKLILSLLQSDGDIFTQLQAMNLAVYQPFQLCVFPESLTITNNNVICVIWNGNNLCHAEIDLPITSSSIDFIEVSQKRRQKFNRLVDTNTPQSNQLKAYHFSTEIIGKHSVNMQREDAKTVSISHISVNKEITFEYFDNVQMEDHTIICAKETQLMLTS